jgi:hypothetical protein
VHSETQKHLQFTPKVEHAYITVYKEGADQFIYDHQIKNLQHESCVKRYGKVTRQRIF